MSEVIRRALAHRSPEELLLIPVVLLIGLAILAQPTAITRLFDSPFATPIPGDSPADVFMNDRRTPAPAPSPVTRATLETLVYDRSGWIVVDETRAARPVGASDCPRGLTLREISVAFQPNAPLQTLSACVDAEGSVVTWDAATGQRMRVLLAPGSVAGR